MGNMEQNNKIALFESKEIRRTVFEGKTYLAVVDVIEALTDSEKPRDYWYRLKKRELEGGGIELSTFCRQFKMEAADGKKRETECADTEGLLRIIQSVPSPKAEPFKRWMAQIGAEHIEEIENPELGIQRIRELYLAKGYTEEWVNTRIKSIDIRKQLTDEWQQRGVKEGQEYAILTSEIAKATFGLSPSEHAKYKNLEKQNLRDHQTNLELIFTMLGEEMTRSIAVDNDAQGFQENHEAALKGGTIAGNARRNVEKDSGKPVVSSVNFLGLKGEEKVKELDE
jgi:DNA-damage-inducible protein D